MSGAKKRAGELAAFLQSREDQPWMVYVATNDGIFYSVRGRGQLYKASIDERDAIDFADAHAGSVLRDARARMVIPKADAEWCRSCDRWYDDDCKADPACPVAIVDGLVKGGG